MGEEMTLEVKDIDFDNIFRQIRYGHESWAMGYISALLDFGLIDFDLWTRLSIAKGRE